MVHDSVHKRLHEISESLYDKKTGAAKDLEIMHGNRNKEVRNPSATNSAQQSH